MYKLEDERVQLELNRLLGLQLKDKVDNRLDYMEWQLYPEQNNIRKQVLNSVINKEGATIFVIFGSNRSGKTECGAGIVAELLGSETDYRVWCSTVSDLSIKVQQRKVNSLTRARDINYGEYNEVRGWKNNVIISKNKTYVNFKTFEQGRAAYQGDAIDLIWLDEEPPWDIFGECIARVTDNRGVILFTFTSLSGFTRLVNYLWETNNPDVVSTVLTLDMNPFIPTEYKESFKRKVDPDEYEMRIEGRPHMKEGLIYKEYKQTTHQLERFDYEDKLIADPLNWVCFEGIDPHQRTPHHWLRFAYHVNSDTLYVVEELKAPKESMLIADFGRLIKAKRAGHPPEYTLIDTSSMIPDVIQKVKGEEVDETNSIRREFLSAGIETQLVSKDNAVGIGAVKSRLKQVATVTEIKRPAKLFIFSDLAGLNWEFLRYSWDSYQSSRINERNEMLNRPKKKNDHYMDILKYQCIRLLRPYTRDLESPHYEEMFEGTGY